jgi:DNA-directed RNA polymerase subunit RPC12/RpoP
VATDRPQEYVCVVCGEPVEARMSADCNWCNGRYHLNQRNDIEAKDCGQVWIDEQYMALQFACDNCLRDVAGQATTAGEQAPAKIREISTRPARARTQVRRHYKRRD